MSFRPRYSLLTLLLLTAGISVGIKLWRGPHHVVLYNPTIAELESFTQIPVANYHVQNVLHQGTTFKYHYLNTLRGRELLTIQCNYPKNFLAICEAPFKRTDKFLWPAEMLGAFRHTSDGDAAICWISGKLKIEYQPGPRVFSNPHYGPAYIVTSRKQLYRIELVDLRPLFLKKVGLNEIDDLEVRSQVEILIATLPES